MILMTRSLTSTAAAVSLLLTSVPAIAADFFLKHGDKVVMMGDSITEQHLYSSICENPEVLE